MIQKAKIIVLNGASSSGKNTIAKQLQDILNEPYLHIGIDNFMKMMPKSYVGNSENSKHGFYLEKTKNNDGREVYITRAGLHGKKVVTGMIYACLALAKKGVNLIIDEVCYGNEQLQVYRNLFEDYNLYCVGVKCPIDILLQREKKEQIIESTAEKELEIVHKGISYDIEVDTSVMTPQECAEDINLCIMRKLS